MRTGSRATARMTSPKLFFSAVAVALLMTPPYKIAKKDIMVNLTIAGSMSSVLLPAPSNGK
jgi:hypothetical protein